MPGCEKNRMYVLRRRVIGTDTYEDVYPLTYSINGNGTMPTIVVESNSIDCCSDGNIGPSIGDIQWREVENDYICNGTTKHAKEEEYEFNGSTWVAMGVYREGSVIEYDSDDCGYSPSVITQWLVDGYTCLNYDKYQQLRQYRSYDNGQTWEPTSTVIRGNLIESNSLDCGYTPPTPPTPTGYTDQYFTFEAIDSGTFKFMGNDLSYSLDSGSTWTTLASQTDTPTVASGQKIMWKATIAASNNTIGQFSSTGRFNVEGNIMSLLYGDNFNTQVSLQGRNNVFNYLFGECSVVSAENLILPATTLSNYCYANMFMDCSLLTVAPVLSAQTLTQSAYNGMFYACSSLTSITCLATDISAYESTFFWTYHVASNGTFIKAASMTSWPSGESGIPSTWSIQNYQS